ncbi:MAG: glucose 1-dehydrogenase [Chloroflexi bacterium]|nr:MAG: glucose 1-dehydrogenase [Chloroflexota bacterium]
MRLKDKTALITGSGSGIGRAIAELFSDEGASVVIVDVIAERAAEPAAHITEKGGQATAMTIDVTKSEQVSQMMKDTLATYGRLDILVNNAAAAEGNDIIDVEEAVWDADLAVVLKSVYLCTRAALPSMKAQRSGAIVNIASVNGLGAYGHMPYSAGKAGVINLTKNLAVTYGEYNIRVNAICPGTIHTPIWDERVKVDPDIFERLARWYPLGRVGQPEDIAKAALFLASDDASWITGEALSVDGGLTAGSFRMSQELEARAPEQTGE